MSDQSDPEDDAASDASVVQDSGESETDQGDHFFDLEAEESEDGHDEDEDEDEDDHHFDDSRHFSFPQFSRLPTELRLTIWETVDPYLKSQGRVLDFSVHEKISGGELWESATLSQQTAPARTLLAINKEARCIASQYYPDTIQLRGGRGQVRFNGSKDIILFRAVSSFRLPDQRPWSDKIKYIALESNTYGVNSITALEETVRSYNNLAAIFYCFDAEDLAQGGPRILDWSVSESSKQFYIETFEEQPGLGEDYKTLYCWPDVTLHASFVDCIGDDETINGLPILPLLPTPLNTPIWPMAQYSFDSGLELYRRREKRYYQRNAGREAGSASSPESTEGESIYESEPDDYALDGFVVGSSSEGNEESSDEDNDDNDDEEGEGEGEDANIHRPYNSSNHEDLSGEEGGEEGGEDHVRFDQDPDTFNGFSPLQDEPSDDEAVGNLPNATSVIYDLDSPDDHLSNASSPEEQPRTITQTGRRKRHIVSSDEDEDDEDGGGPTVENHARVNKRARVILSDSEDEEGGNKNGAKPETSRPKKRVRIVLSDSEDGEDEGHGHNEAPRPRGYKADEKDDEDDESDEVTEDDEGEEESPVSKPTSLLARLRQFRSDVPVSPEGESSNSEQEFNEDEQYEDEEGRRLSDAEFPDSAGEDGEEEGW